jgi:hypothetical protein
MSCEVKACTNKHGSTHVLTLLSNVLFWNLFVYIFVVLMLSLTCHLTSHMWIRRVAHGNVSAPFFYTKYLKLRLLHASWNWVVNCQHFHLIYAKLTWSLTLAKSFEGWVVVPNNNFLSKNHHATFVCNNTNKQFIFWWY